MKRLKRILGVAAVVADLLLSTAGCAIDVVGVDLDGDGHHAGNVEVSAPFLLFPWFGWPSGASGHGGQRYGQHRRRVRDPGGGGERRSPGPVRHACGDAQAHLADLHVTAQAGPVEFDIKTHQPSRTQGRTYIVDYEIAVPSHLTVTVAHGNGTIRVKGIHADLKVTNGNGDVDLVDVSGSSWVSLGNGEITAWTHLPLGGQIVHSVGNGSLFLSVQPQVSASFGAKVGNGTISVIGLDMQQVDSTPRQLSGLLGIRSGIDRAFGREWCDQGAGRLGEIRGEARGHDLLFSLQPGPWILRLSN